MSTAAPRLYVVAEGRGPAIVLGHGFGGSARNLGGLARALRDAYRVVRFDARGHGRSAAPDDPAAYTPAAFVGDVGRVLDQVGVARAVIGGVSMGAGIALRFALAHPARTRALVLAAFPSSAGSAGSLAADARRFADAIERAGLEAAGAEFVWGPDAGLDATTARLVRRGFLEHAAHGLAYTLRGVLAVQPAVAELAPALATVTVPALVIVGAEDRRSLAASRELAAALPHARLVVVAGSGHLVNLTKPAEFNAAVVEFLRACPLS